MEKEWKRKRKEKEKNKMWKRIQKGMKVNVILEIRKRMKETKH